MPPTAWVDVTVRLATTQWDGGETQWDEAGNVATTQWDVAEINTTWSPTAAPATTWTEVT